MAETYRCDKHGTEQSGYCESCVTAFRDRRDAATMTAQERADEFRWWGDILTMPFDDLHKRIEELVGRSVWTHELARPDLLIAEIKGGSPSSLSGVLDKFPKGKPVVVIQTEHD